MSERRDNASISFNVQLPPEVIKEYFDGMAKVEKAKQHTQKSSNIDWSAIAAMSLPLLTTLMRQQENGKTDRKRKKEKTVDEDANFKEVINKLLDCPEIYDMINNVIDTYDAEMSETTTTPKESDDLPKEKAENDTDHQRTKQNDELTPEQNSRALTETPEEQCQDNFSKNEPKELINSSDTTEQPKSKKLTNYNEEMPSTQGFTGDFSNIFKVLGPMVSGIKAEIEKSSQKAAVKSETYTLSDESEGGLTETANKPTFDFESILESVLNETCEISAKNDNKPSAVTITDDSQ
jgi:hypothetical protein